mmetsp:Transcript_17973/g.40836  ORF Transcript_17973/g.40836 Transcript_17973/m.40836 type:complete len:1388 (-) Transcript_17973:432-4595(-)|eukprot:CAMPEP_0113306088 /NCGR_PEP_ID=MMETSP0010_2-20120614/5479_1 /TAXON_ID=216773 ORGANISM="Corethron hystrix, Strain 308" /NCGR_SAMPLE_ID=MMETSP0010_2 /ASSEMBLY_ACC=CAM_ASM_000155 /LENGTH=1387 /DNA_ID=CAMNT_0000160685 /DNA_START=785 /DNA_END=4948 /DNA_ORIENTATION=- /assembly_acc=CAM_ASM_000155
MTAEIAIRNADCVVSPNSEVSPSSNNPIVSSDINGKSMVAGGGVPNSLPAPPSKSVPATTVGWVITVTTTAVEIDNSRPPPPQPTIAPKLIVTPQLPISGEKIDKVTSVSSVGQNLLLTAPQVDSLSLAKPTSKSILVPKHTSTTSNPVVTKTDVTSKPRVPSPTVSLDQTGVKSERENDHVLESTSNSTAKSPTTLFKQQPQLQPQQQHLHPQQRSQPQFQPQSQQKYPNPNLQPSRVLSSVGSDSSASSTSSNDVKGGANAPTPILTPPPSNTGTSVSNEVSVVKTHIRLAAKPALPAASAITGTTNLILNDRPKIAVPSNNVAAVSKVSQPTQRTPSSVASAPSSIQSSLVKKVTTAPADLSTHHPSGSVITNPPKLSASLPKQPVATFYSDLSTLYLHELEYMHTEFRKLERQLQLGAEAAALRSRAAALAVGKDTNIAVSGETPSAKDRREKLGMFISHLSDTIWQIVSKSGKDATGAAAIKSQTEKDREEEKTAVKKLEQHILTNLLPVKSRLTKQLASNNAPAKPHHPTVMPHVAPRQLGTFAEAAKAKAAASQTTSQFGKPLNGTGSSLTQKLHGSTLGSTSRKYGSGVGTTAKNEEGTKGLQYAGLTPKPEPNPAPAAPGNNATVPPAVKLPDVTSSSLTPPSLVQKAKMNLPLHKAAVAAAMAPTVKKPASAKAKAAAAAASTAKLAMQKASLSAKRKFPSTSITSSPIVHGVVSGILMKPSVSLSHTIPAEVLPSDKPLVDNQVVIPAVKFKKRRRKASSAICRPLSNGMHPCSQRQVEFQCSLCNEAYVGAVRFNPWWALSQENCPKCNKLQIPRIDISNPINGIEYHPALIAHQEDDANSNNGPSVGPQHHLLHHHMGPAQMPINEEDDGSEGSETDTDDEHLEGVEDYGKGYVGPVFGEVQARALLLLMDHARTCPGCHKNEKQKQVCDSTKFMMMHVRDCPGSIVSNEPCPYPWCRKMKHLCHHVAVCKQPSCAVCAYKVVTKDKVDRTNKVQWKNLKHMNEKRWEKVDKKWQVTQLLTKDKVTGANKVPLVAGIPHHPAKPPVVKNASDICTVVKPRTPIPPSVCPNINPNLKMKTKKPTLLPSAVVRTLEVPDAVTSIDSSASRKTAMSQTPIPVVHSNKPVSKLRTAPLSKLKTPAIVVRAIAADPSKPATAALIAAAIAPAVLGKSNCIPEALLSNDGDSFSVTMGPATAAMERRERSSGNIVPSRSNSLTPFFDSNPSISLGLSKKILSSFDMRASNKSISTTLDRMTSNNSISNIIASSSITNMMSSQSVGNLMASQSISNLMATLPSSDGINIIGDNSNFNETVDDDVMDVLLENEQQQQRSEIGDITSSLMRLEKASSNGRDTKDMREHVSTVLPKSKPVQVTG